MGRFKQHYHEVVEPAWNYAKRITSHQGHQQNALIGLASESGELLDVGKKLWFHTEKPLDSFREKLLSELGDVIFYWLKAVHVFGFTTKEVLDYNRKKLESRHPELNKVEERFGAGYIK